MFESKPVALLFGGQSHLVCRSLVLVFVFI
jgi:hypothetical protein